MRRNLYEDIQEITIEDFEKMMDSVKITSDDCTYSPLGKFYVRLGKTYVGIDNGSGHAWTETFDSLKTCKKWLIGEFEIGFEIDAK